MPALDSETENALRGLIDELSQLLGERVKHVYARAASPVAGGDPMADVDVLLVADELSKPEVYRIWNLTGEASVKHDVMFSVQSYSTADFEERRDLPVIRIFLTEGAEYGAP